MAITVKGKSFTFALKVRGIDVSTFCVFLNLPDFYVSFEFIDETHWWEEDVCRDEKGVEELKYG